MNAVQLVTIKNFHPVYRDGEEALNIQLVEVEEHGFLVVSQKGLYKIGDRAVFLQPDYCLSDIPLFEPFIRPDGNPNKSRLGRNNRIKAIKFNFADSSGNAVYSRGILLPFDEVNKQLDQLNQLADLSLDEQFENIDAILGITKYIEPEKTINGDSIGDLPSGMYKTDETDINNKWRVLEKLLPLKMIGTLKIDGSSTTTFSKPGITTQFGICSREQEKKLIIDTYPGWQQFKNKDLEKTTNGMRNEVTKVFVPFTEWEQYVIDNNIETVSEPSKDSHVVLATPILEKLKECGKFLSIRSEVYGQGLRGSGNKHNPHAKFAKSIATYGIDDYSTGVCIPLPMNEVIDLCVQLSLTFVDIVTIETISSREQLEQISREFFKTEKEDGRLVEGIVWRSFENTSFTAKYMNPEYDSMK